MSKKKKKKAVRKMVTIDRFLEDDSLSRKKINKKFKKAVKKYEEEHVLEFEKRKKKDKRHRRKINKEAKKFYYECEDVKDKVKQTKKYEKRGFFEQALGVIGEVIPMIKSLAKMVALAITGIVSTPFVRNRMSTKTLDRVASVYNVAASI
jgi:hypothetical protein